MIRNMDQFDGMAKRCFGPGASVFGTMGNSRFAGVVRIDLDGQPLGSGPTFAEALEAAQSRASRAAAALSSADQAA